MKKFLMLLLQLLSLFIFIVLVVGIFDIISNVIKNSQEGLAYNFGYFFGGIVIIGLLFWLNIKLFRYTNRNDKQ